MVFIYKMPAVNPNNASGDGGGAQRTSFRPPWVKEGPTPLPMPTAPWTARAREASASVNQEETKVDKPGPRKLSKVTIVPTQPIENNAPDFIGQANLKWNPKNIEKEGPSHSGRRESTTIPVVLESKRKESTDKFIPIKVESKRKESTAKAPEQERRKESIVQIKREPEKDPPKAARAPVAKPVEPPKSILKDPSKTSVPKPPPAPPAPPAPPMAPMAPPLPPPPPSDKSKIEMLITPEKAAKLEALRSRPRRRPDWTDMMKEVESGIRLKHIQCNDRSAPILPKSKANASFVYDSEKEAATNNPHKVLLTEIQKGVRLKRVKCNDRSKPILDGLRKFRRQMTIEEQIQKSMSMADVVAVATEPDELDDIDKVRDDLQSTKQMLALELRNKEALERENKRLMARLLNLEVELEKEKNARIVEPGTESGEYVRSAADQKLVQKLKEESVEANRVAKEMEEKYRYTAEELDATRAKLESAWLRNQQLELELKTGARSNVNPQITKQLSSKKLALSLASMPNGKGKPVESEESEYTDETETETETEEEDDDDEANVAAKEERRLTRELKLLASKLRSFKDKQAAALKERKRLRDQLRKQQKTLREEKKKYKSLQKEVDKMAKLMKDEEEEEEEEEEEKPDEEEETDTESESDSEESEEEELTDGDLPEDAPVDVKRKNLTDRSKHHETRLGTLKKGNYLLKANIDRLQDDINRQREMSVTLQEDLNSVLAELG